MVSVVSSDFLKEVLFIISLNTYNTVVIYM